MTGDTKVVDRGKGDGIFINTAGIGLVPGNVEISPAKVQPGDAILVSGDLGRHGMAVMSVREGLGFEGNLQSDCASLAGLVEAMLAADRTIHCLRDLTRGGLAAALNEIAADAKSGAGLERVKEQARIELGLKSFGNRGIRTGRQRLRNFRTRPFICGQRRPAGGICTAESGR